MSLLDELGREADAARRQRDAESARQEAHEAASKARLEPAMEQVETFFRQLSSHLRTLHHERTVAYDLPDLGRLQGLVQGNYRAGWTEHSGRRRFVVSCRCVGNRPLETRLDSEPRAAAAERFLRGAGLHSSRAHQGHGGVTLLIAADVPVSLAFETDTTDGALLFTARNLFELCERTHRFDPARVDETLMDAIGRMLLGERAEFDRLTGNTVDEAQRSALALRLARERRQRDAELAGPLRRAVFPLTEWFRRTFLKG